MPLATAVFPAKALLFNPGTAGLNAEAARAKNSTISVTIQSNLKILRKKCQSSSPSIAIPLKLHLERPVTRAMAAQNLILQNPPTQVVDHVFQANAN